MGCRGASSPAAIGVRGWWLARARGGSGGDRKAGGVGCGGPRLVAGADEPMTRQYVSTNGASDCFHLRFGSFSFDDKYQNDARKFTASGLSSKIIFRGAIL